MFKFYNGCPNKELQQHLDSLAKLDVSGEEWGFRLTYFPMEEKWAAFKEYEQITQLLPTKQQAFYKAVEYLTR